MKSVHRFIVLSVLLSLTGCSSSFDPMDDTEAVVDEADLSLVIDNALNPNALNPNALNPNALNPNALNPNALNPNALNPSALSASALQAIQRPDADGDMSRMLLRYVVSCALDPNQSFSFSWTDAQNVVHAEVYEGHMGLSPAWLTGPLDSRGQQMVSACLASRSNYYGVSVLISLRSAQEPLKSQTTNDELDAYSRVEGAFWGNVFAPAPYLRACYRLINVANSRAHYRDCAAGHLNADQSVSECGMIQILGPCPFHCKNLTNTGEHYPECHDPVYGKTANVITSGIP